MNPIAYVREIVRYPVKSMAGLPTDSAHLGWHGLAGDRRFAFRRLGDTSGFPWLTASRLPELVCYHPRSLLDNAEEPCPTQVLTPDGQSLELHSTELRSEITTRLGSPVELMKLKHGIFDDAAVSIINISTIAAIGREVGVELDCRRFRANIVLEAVDGSPFAEDAWVGGTLLFGNSSDGPAVSIISRDVRCVMINIDPDTAQLDGRVLKAAVKLNNNHAGVYATVLRTGMIQVGDAVSILQSTHLAPPR
jgi:uncharacterized protein